VRDGTRVRACAHQPKVVARRDRRPTRLGPWRRRLCGMTNKINISTRTAATAALAAGVAIFVFGSLSIADSQSAEDTTVGIEHVILGGLTVTLVLLIPVVLHLGRLAGKPRAAAVTVTGQALLAALTVVSNVRGEDPSFFAAVAAPSNLMIVGGLIALAVGLRRREVLSRSLAIALPLSWILTLAMGGVFSPIAGAYWLAIGWMLRNGELPYPVVTPSMAVMRRNAS
jgi:hypothetical protein